MKLLDLFCCEGGAGRGYALAGFDVTGVDIVDRSARYPYPFRQADALEYLAAHGHEYDAIHASPPCQAYSVTRSSHGKTHPDLVAPTREALEATGKPYVIENVVGAPLVNPITLCGAAFNLVTPDEDGTMLYLRRHRLFESNVWLWPVECECLTLSDRGYRCAGVYGNGPSDRTDSTVRGGYTPKAAVRGRLLGIDWMSRDGLSQSIPPAYTHHLGRTLLEHLDAA